MQIDSEKVEVTTEEARGAVTEHGVRYVLFFGLLLAIILLSAIWITGSIYK
jgi:cobalamin biosynthesis Mg chelatase CobN